MCEVYVTALVQGGACWVSAYFYSGGVGCASMIIHAQQRIGPKSQQLDCELVIKMSCRSAGVCVCHWMADRQCADLKDIVSRSSDFARCARVRPHRAYLIFTTAGGKIACGVRTTSVFGSTCQLRRACWARPDDVDVPCVINELSAYQATAKDCAMPIELEGIGRHWENSTNTLRLNQSVNHSRRAYDCRQTRREHRWLSRDNVDRRL